MLWPRTTRAQSKMHGLHEHWVTETEYGGPKFLNDPKLAAVAITSSERRLHATNKALHDAGVYEYQVFVEMKNWQTTETESAEIERQSAIDNDDAKIAADLMLKDTFAPAGTSPVSKTHRKLNNKIMKISTARRQSKMIQRKR